MKKPYINPRINNVLLSQTNMIAFSTNADGLGKGGNTADAGISEGGVKVNNHSVWDDDWSR